MYLSRTPFRVYFVADDKKSMLRSSIFFAIDVLCLGPSLPAPNVYHGLAAEDMMATRTRTRVRCLRGVRLIGPARSLLSADDARGGVAEELLPCPGPPYSSTLTDR